MLPGHMLEQGAPNSNRRHRYLVSNVAMSVFGCFCLGYGGVSVSAVSSGYYYSIFLDVRRLYSIRFEMNGR
jgi:hypothetical protein